MPVSAQDRGTILGQRPDQIALGQDARDRHAVLADDERADALERQPMHGGGDGRIRADGHDLTALVVEDLLDLHLGAPW